MLRELDFNTGYKAFLVDRKEMPSDAKLARGDYFLDQQEISDRLEFVFKCREEAFHASNWKFDNKFLYLTTAWGDMVHGKAVVVYGTSPHLSPNMYWQLMTGLESRHFPSEKTIEPIFIAHEAFHIVPPPLGKTTQESEYWKEATPDRLSIEWWLNDAHGKESAALDFARFRRAPMFFAGSPLCYRTGAICEATIEQTIAPSYDEYSKIVRELEIRTEGLLLGNDYSQLDTKALWRETSTTLVSHTCNGVRTSESIWTDPSFGERLASRPAYRGAQALETVLETSKCLSAPVREEGEKIHEAYKYFCPGPYRAPKWSGIMAKFNQLLQEAF